MIRVNDRQCGVPYFYKVADIIDWIRHMMAKLNRIQIHACRLFSKFDLAASSRTTLSFSCFIFCCNFNSDLFKPLGILSRNSPCLPPCPIFTLTTLLIKENEYFVTTASFLLAVHFIFELADQPVMRMSSICWIELMKYGSLMEKKKKRKSVCHLPDYKIFHIWIFECLIRLLFLCSDTKRHS